MPTSWFANPLYLVGLAGAALPLLIHLLTRDRVQRVVFPSLRFFVRTARASLVRRRFEEMLLIALRCVVCALLAVAFANPLFNREADARAFGPDSRSRLLLIDRSASIRREPVRKAWKREMAALVDSTDDSTRTAVVAFDSAPRVLADFDASPDEAREQLEGIQVGYGASDLVGALRKAADMIGRERTATREIVLLSDLPRRSWTRYKGDWRLPGGVTLTVEYLSDRVNDNVHIAETNVPAARVGTAKACPIAVRVANDSPADLDAVPVSLVMGGETVETREVPLPAGRASNVRFRRLLDDGDNPGAVRIDRPDASPLDNETYFTIVVQPKVRVVILNGHPSSDRRRDAAFFLKTALSVGEANAFDVHVLDATTTDGEEIRKAAAQVRRADVVLLADVSTVADAVGGALGDVVVRGGGLLFLPGGHVDGEAFSRDFRDLAPCGLRQVIEPTGTAAPMRIGEVQTDHPALEAFAAPRHGNFTTARFHRYWDVTRSQTAHVLARFQNGRPALLEKPRGKGLSMLSLTPTDPTWTDFPMRVLFVPYVHELVRYLGARAQDPATLVVGEKLPAGEATGPNGQPLPASDATAEAPGIYTIQTPGGGERKVAVNVDRAEFDVRRVDPKEIVEALRPAPDESREAARARREGERTGLWMWVMLGFALLSVAELAVANRTIRH
jgi:hypothetical protein